MVKNSVAMIQKVIKMPLLDNLKVQRSCQRTLMNVASEVGSSAIDDAEPEGQNAVSDNEEPTNQESKEDLSNNHSSDPQPEAKTSEDESVNDKEEHDSGEPEMQENVHELCTDDQKPILELGEKEDAAEDKTKEDGTEYIETEDEEAGKETSKEDKQGSSSQAEKETSKEDKQG